jgi:hypothetical protein
MKKYAIIIFLFGIITSSAQNDSIFNRLQAIHNNGISFYNIDGYSITSQTLNYPFTEKGLKKAYRKYSIKKKAEKIKTNNYLIIITI